MLTTVRSTKLHRKTTRGLISSRRVFLGGLLAVVAAPAIVRIDNIMPVRASGLIRPRITLLTSADGHQWNLLGASERGASWYSMGDDDYIMIAIDGADMSDPAQWHEGPGPEAKAYRIDGFAKPDLVLGNCRLGRII